MAGNTATISSSIILDTEAPYSLSVIIKSSSFKSLPPKMTIKLSANDDTSGVYQMSFSFDSETWTDWEEFTEEKTITLVAVKEENILFFKVNDGAGNVALPTSMIFIVNTTNIENNTNGNKTDNNKTDPVAQNTETIIPFMELFIFIIIFVIVILIILFLVLRRRRREEPDAGLESSLTVKPGTFASPEIMVGSMTTAPDPDVGKIATGQPTPAGALPGQEQAQAKAQAQGTPTIAASTTTAQPTTILPVPSAAQTKGGTETKPVQQYIRAPQLPPAPESETEWVQEEELEQVGEPVLTQDQEVLSEIPPDIQPIIDHEEPEMPMPVMDFEPEPEQTVKGPTVEHEVLEDQIVEAPDIQHATAELRTAGLVKPSQETTVVHEGDKGVWRPPAGKDHERDLDTLLKNKEVLEQLERLLELKEKGALTEAEFVKKKGELLK